ncbi:hypothetical protein HanHA300_Chr02g0069481 [Helianthus annuus]|nr:hypothetical protein HanHA300_Chr02g0069481 [Helianthus annuus]
MSLDPVMQRVTHNVDEHISQLMECKPLSEQERLCGCMFCEFEV